MLSNVHAILARHQSRLPLGPTRMGRQTPKKTRSATMEGGGLKPPDPLQMEPRASLQCHHKNVPHTGSLTTGPASPIAPAAEQDEVLGLAVALRELAYHHLEFSGWERQGKGYL